MARAKPNIATIAEAAPSRLLRSKGPLSPSETEIIVYAGLKDGCLVATPEEFSVRAKTVFNLITDRPEIANRLAHNTLFKVADVPELRATLLKLCFSRHTVSANDNQAAVAGGFELLDSALNEAYKIILFVEGSDMTLPSLLNDWKASKPDTRTTPPSITLVRE